MPSIKPVYSIAISEIPAKFKHEIANIMWKKLQNYKIAVTSEGFFIDTISNAPMKVNHLRCLLRRDYHNETGKYCSSYDVNYIIDGILQGATAATKATCAKLNASSLAAG